MSRINALKGKTDTIIVGDFTINVKSLSFPKLMEFSDLADNDKKVNSELITGIVFDCLRTSLPTREVDKDNGFTDKEIYDEIEDMDPSIAIQIFKRVLELSGLSDEKKS